MTRKDYELIANVLKASRPEASSRDLWDKIVQNFIDELGRNNSRFNGHKFREACGL